jgi:acyl carrier protein
VLTKEEVGPVILRELRAIAAEEAEYTGDLDPAAITADARLHDAGVNSLMLARLLVQLEAELSVDPFGQEDAAISDVRSVNDLITAYQQALAG